MKISYGAIEISMPAIKKVYEIENLKIALEARKNIKKILDEFSHFEKAREDYIKKHGNEQGVIENGTPEYEEAVKYINGLMNQEVNVSWEKFLSVKDLEESNLALSAKDIDLLELVGVLKN